MRSIIEAKGVHKAFGPQLVLNSVDLTIYEGEMVAIMGPSGSGKTTLLFALSGMDPVDEGEVFFRSKRLKDYNEDSLAELRRLEMGFIFQQATMVNHLNILDNVLLPALQGKVVNRDRLVNRAQAYLAMVGIEDLAQRDISQVSGGQLQRAGICRALMMNPFVLFGDEPTGALNSASAREIMEILKDINNRGTTILLVTHDPQVASLCHRVLFLKDGAVEEDIYLADHGDEIQRLKKLHDIMTRLGI